MEYVNFIFELTRIHGNAKTDAPRKPLPTNLPLFGPKFQPPSFADIQKRSLKPIKTPDLAYLKPLHIIHPFYYPELSVCPHCGATGKDVRWDSWTTTGHRDIYGLQQNECALGYQLRCNICKQANIGKSHTRRRRRNQSANEGGGNVEEPEDDETYCVATTSFVFWSGWEFWKIPCK